MPFFIREEKMGLTRLRTITRKLSKSSSDEEQRALVTEFITSLEDAIHTLDEFIAELEEEYQRQVVAQRNAMDKILSVLPDPVKPERLREQERKIEELRRSRERIRRVSLALKEIESKLAHPREVSPEELENYLIEVSFPGEQRTDSHLEIIERRIERLETHFYESMDGLNQQLTRIHEALKKMTTELQQQGMKLDDITTKTTEIEQRLERVQKSMNKISRALTENKILLGLLLGAVIALLVVILI